MLHRKGTACLKLFVVHKTALLPDIAIKMIIRFSRQWSKMTVDGVYFVWYNKGIKVCGSTECRRW